MDNQQGIINANKDSQIMIGLPSKPPTELLNSLITLYSTIKEIKKAYNAHYFNPNTDTNAHTIIGIEATGNWDYILSASGSIVNNTIIPDPPVDFFQIKNNDNLSNHIKNQFKPFYIKKLFGIF